MSLPATLAILASVWLAANALLLFRYRSELRRLWLEPVFRYPILVIESDDWGAGPLSQATALHDIANVLAKHRDATGRAPVFNLALVLAIPDGPAVRRSGCYQRICLDAPMFGPVLVALREGQGRGVFALQLHGMEHYWPAALMASIDVQVRDWLGQVPPAATEQLPSPLQSRWVDASQLPSRPHSNEAICAAVAEEVSTYARIFGTPPKVVVPPTFVWTRSVELAWADQGLECVVTPGWRYIRRNRQGQPDGDEGPILNGDQAGTVTYLSRIDYFEPSRGRDAAYALKALQRATAEGRPCLLENHRDNFIGSAAQRERSLIELDKVYCNALAQHLDVRFLSSWDLGRILRDRDPRWLYLGFRGRLSHLFARLRGTGRLWKLLALSGSTGVALVVLLAIAPSH